MTPPTTDIFDAAWLRRARPTLSGVARLAWRAPQQGPRLVQVYVDRRLYDVTPTSDVRAMWLHLEPGPPEPVVELVAVDPADRWTDHGAWRAKRHANVQPTASLQLARDEALPLDSRVRVGVDGEPAGEAAMWGPRDSRAGFGAAFGLASFGDDGATPPGLDRGAFGLGPFGRDGHPWQWRDRDLPDGRHLIDATVTDRHGRTVAELPEPRAVTITRPPQPPTHLRIETGPTCPTGLRLCWSD